MKRASVRAVALLAALVATALIVASPAQANNCTPGFYKTHLGAHAWTVYSPTLKVSDVFSPVDPSLADATLLDALSFQGGTGVVGAEEILLRAAVARLLNATRPNSNLSTSDVISMTDAALASGDRATMLALARQWDLANNAGTCPGT